MGNMPHTPSYAVSLWTLEHYHLLHPCKDRYRSGYGIWFGTDLQYYITGYSSYCRSHSLDIKACPYFTYPQ
jgi:hypothetical protein